MLELRQQVFPTPWVDARFNGKKLAEKVFLEWGEKFDWPELAQTELTDEGFCYGLRNQIAVLCDGTVVPCCLDHEGDIGLGNLFTQTMEEIFASPRAKAMFTGFSNRVLTAPLCRTCGYATGLQRNRKMGGN